MSKRKKSCEFCECGIDDYYTIVSEESEDVIAEVYPGHCIAFFATMYNERTEEKYEATVELPMSYCPSCGAKLN